MIVSYKDGAYIGMRANITARHDLVVGENAIVGASTLVNKSVPRRGLLRGCAVRHLAIFFRNLWRNTSVAAWGALALMVIQPSSNGITNFGMKPKILIPWPLCFGLELTWFVVSIKNFAL